MCYLCDIYSLQVATAESIKKQSALSRAVSIAGETFSSIRTVVAFGGEIKAVEK